MSDQRTALAIEISSSGGRVAVVRGEELLFSASFASQRSHNAQLFAPLREALSATGDSLQLIAVGTGPGSYTGVRIAIAAAQGVSLSRGAPVIGLPSILVPEAAGERGSFAIVGDARRDSAFVASVADGAMQGEIQLIPHADLAAWMARQDGLPVFAFEARMAEQYGLTLTAPSAILLARAALALSASRIAELSAVPVEPVYLREAFITTPKRPWLQV